MSKVGTEASLRLSRRQRIDEVFDLVFEFLQLSSAPTCRSLAVVSGQGTMTVKSDREEWEF